MPAFPTKQIPIEIYLTLEYNAERHKVLVLTHAILPLEEDLESSLTLFFKLLVNDRGISPGKQASILREELFNSLVVHGTSLVSCGVVQGDTLQKTHRPIRNRIKTEGLSAEISSCTLH